MKLAFLGLLLVTSFASPVEARKVRCSDFPNWEAAQTAYEENPYALRHLDRDKDGIACEALRK